MCQVGTVRCSRCKAAYYYCSPQCQKEHWVSGHKGQCGALSAQKKYIATTAAASAKQQAPQMTAAPQPQPSLKKSTEATNSPPSLFSPTQLSNLLSTRPQELGVGLVNRGNTCYINSVLQCFSHTAPLRAYLASSEHSRSCKVRTHGFCLLCALEEHTKQLFRVTNEFFPRDIFLNLQQIGDFRPFAQEDAHEFASGVMMGKQSTILQNYRAAPQRPAQLRPRLRRDQPRLPALWRPFPQQVQQGGDGAEAADGGQGAANSRGAAQVI